MNVYDCIVGICLAIAEGAMVLALAGVATLLVCCLANCWGIWCRIARHMDDRTS